MHTVFKLDHPVFCPYYGQYKAFRVKAQRVQTFNQQKKTKGNGKERKIVVTIFRNNWAGKILSLAFLRPIWHVQKLYSDQVMMGQPGLLFIFTWALRQRYAKVVENFFFIKNFQRTWENKKEWAKCA
jgi:hypothetical protein